MTFGIIVTIGPSVLAGETLEMINQSGPCIYRINGAHSDAKSASELIKIIRSRLPEAKIMIDLPGNKIRTANLDNPIQLNKNEPFSMRKTQFNFDKFHEFVKKGDIIFANDSTLKIEVMSVDSFFIHFKSHSDGILNTNKGFHLQGINDGLPFLFQRDLDLIEVSNKEKIAFISLSFVRNAQDVREAKKFIEDSSRIFAKIETKQSLSHLEEIMAEADNFNVDRGDLSADIGLVNIPSAQEKIISTAKSLNKKIFLATQFLKSMENQPVPYIAEVSDLARSIQIGINGIQLSEETAIGKYPKECVHLAFEMYKLLKVKKDS